jgi:hypothetical protein
MTAERWRRVEELYHAALARDEFSRGAFLAEICAGDVVRQVFKFPDDALIRGMTWTAEGRSVIVGQQRASSDIVLFDQAEVGP